MFIFENNSDSEILSREESEVNKEDMIYHVILQNNAIAACDTLVNNGIMVGWFRIINNRNNKVYNGNMSSIDW